MPGVDPIVGAVLAAGAGVRLGAPKATVVLDGERLVDRAVRTLAGAGCAEVIAVARTGLAVAGARVVVNPEPERGMRSSLELAVDAAGAARALAVVLVDLPGLTPDGVRQVIDAWRPGRIAVAGYGGRRGHPTVMSPALWRDAIKLAGPNEGARALLRSRPDLVDEIPVEGDPADLDTPADLARWQQQCNRRPTRGLGRTIPALPVKDVDAAVAHYRDRLGFDPLHVGDGFAVLQRDDARIHLWQAGDMSWTDRTDLLARPVTSGAETFLAGTASCRIEAEDVDGLYEELAKAGVLHPVSRQGVRDTDFGTREFATLDTDGNLIEFFGRVR
jgi:molybdenum cofactor cytidylyltransferase/nicotine blue oxidoreductase